MTLWKDICDYVDNAKRDGETNDDITLYAEAEFSNRGENWKDLLEKALDQWRPVQMSESRGRKSPPKKGFNPPAKPAKEKPQNFMSPVLCKAPYRFIPLNQQIVGPQCLVKTSWKSGTLHSEPFDDGLSGSLSYQLVFNGPVLVGGNPQTEPVKIGDCYTIPGPTIRGCIRSVLEIASFAKLTQTDLEKVYPANDKKTRKGHSVRSVLARTASGKHLLPNQFLREGPDAWCPDFAEALFGYGHEVEEDDAVSSHVSSHASTHNLRHLKGRVGFSFAYLEDPTKATETKPVKATQLAPKPSFSPFYLANDKKAPDWSDESSKLAGYKRYPVRNADFAQVKSWLNNNPKKLNNNPKDEDETSSNLTFLTSKSKEKPLTFHGTVRVHNITLIELGALLWSMTLGDRATHWHNLGRAKTAGSGQCQFHLDQGLAGLIPNTGDKKPTVQAAITDFINYMDREIGAEGKWSSSETIRGLLNVTNPKLERRAKPGQARLS